MVSLTAQVISLAASFIMALIVPKFVSELTYSYWQMYMLYVGYVGVLHFGLLDGIILRYGSYDYDELDKKRMRSQFQFLVSVTTLAAAILLVLAWTVFHGAERMVFTLVAVGIISKNIVTYNSYIFQITNRINKYAVVTIAQRVTMGVVVVALLLLRVDDFYWFCLADLIADVICFVIGTCFNRGSVYFGRSIPLREAGAETGANLRSGIILMLANWSSILLVGSARMFTEWRWGQLVFGKVSFAFSLANVFLTVVTAVSIVLFPSLKRLQEDKLPSLYTTMRKVITIIMFAAMMLYFPGAVILELWMPLYSVSLKYLAILLPIIIFSSKINLLTNNYLKVYRKERMMLLVNVISVAVGAALFSASAYLFNNLEALLVCVVVTVMLNSILSELVVTKVIGKKIYWEFFIELVMTGGFIAIATCLPYGWGALAYFGLLAAYSALNYKTLKGACAKLLHVIRRRPAAESAGEVAENAAEGESGSVPESAPQTTTGAAEQTPDDAPERADERAE